MPTDPAALFALTIDELTGSIQRAPAGRELDAVRPLAWRLAELAQALGYSRAPLEFQHKEQADGWCIDSYRTTQPWGGQVIDVLLSKCRLNAAPGDAVREVVERLDFGVLPEYRDTLLRNLQAWRNSVESRRSYGGTPDDHSYVQSPADAAGQPGGSAVANSVPGVADEPTVPSVDDGSHFSPAKLAEVFSVPADALRTRLNRWRETHHDGWIENSDRRPREPKYLYRVGSVRPIIDGLKATSETTSERPA